MEETEMEKMADEIIRLTLENSVLRDNLRIAEETNANLLRMIKQPKTQMVIERNEKGEIISI